MFIALSPPVKPYYAQRQARPVSKEPLVTPPLYSHHLIDDIPLKTKDGKHTMVVEIFAGERAKLEADHHTGQLFHKVKNGIPRYIKYLGFPTPYGFLPQTLGFDDDPIDAIYLGDVTGKPGIAIQGRVIGAVKKVNKGMINYKVIVAPDHGPFARVQDVNDLPAGVSDILKLWFSFYARYTDNPVHELMTRQEALAFVKECHERWLKAKAKTSIPAIT